jgi:peptidoglycan-associated lipoprotein
MAVVLVLSGVLVAGCAKQPATLAASAPAPTGSTAISSTKSGGDAASTVRPAAARSGSSSGATASTVRPEPKDFRAIADLLDVHFDFDRYDIRPDATKTLESNARLLRARTGSLILIEGHCDERGTNEYNLALGERRAQAARNALVAHGVETSRISIVSYGEDRPQCRDHSEACWAKNRRARFLVKDR